jgi:hypothetical protein
VGVQINKSSATAPEFEDNVYDARLDNIVQESHPEWATESGKYGPDDGERIGFNFTLFDGEDMIYREDGKPFTVNKLTSTSMGSNSKFAATMSGILTPVEKALIEAGETVDSDTINGRRVQLVLSHNESGWPKIDAIIPAKKVK